MAGHTISLYLKKRGHDVTGFARTESVHVQTIVGDAYNAELIKRTIVKNKYDSIVNCIGILNRDADDNKDQAVYINAYLPHYLERITDGRETRVIHMSTDCVFSGKRGQYTEDDIKDGESFYDRSKALGELENNKDFTIRTSIIGPDLNPNGTGLLNWFMKQKGTVDGYAGFEWTGITTLQLAKSIEEIAEKRYSGLCNIVPSNSISKYDLLMLCNEEIREDPVVICPKDNPKINKSLITKRNLISTPDYEVMIKELALWMDENKNLYPHYHIKQFKG